MEIISFTAKNESFFSMRKMNAWGHKIILESLCGQKAYN